MKDNSKAKKAHQELRKIVDRFVANRPQGLSEAQQGELLQLAQALVSYVLELEMVNQAQRQIIRELPSSEFRHLFEFVPTARLQLSKKGIVQRTNQNAANMLSGRPGGTVLGSAFTSFVQTEDLGTFLRCLKRSDSQELSPVFKLRLINAAGQPVHVHCQVSHNNDPDGGFSHWQLTFLDLTVQQRLEAALQASQQHLELATRAGGIGIWVSDYTTGYAYWNEQLYRLLGLTPRAGPEHRDAFFEFIDPADRQNMLQGTQKLLSNGNEFKRELRIVRADDGRVRWLASRGTVDRDAAGRAVRMQGVNFDITVRKQAEEALQTSLAEKEVLLKEIHHRVKNNMQVLSSLISLQYDSVQDETVRAVLQDVTNRVWSMAMIHEKLYESDDLARVHFDDYTQDLLNYLWRVHGKAVAGIRLGLNLEPVRLPVHRAVPCGLILNELASNALKHAFSERSDGLVIVSLSDGSNGRVRLSVRDDGKGLPPGFDWRQTGSLGLRLVQMLTRQLDAEVAVSSEEGAEFVITFQVPEKRRGTG